MLADTPTGSIISYLATIVRRHVRSVVYGGTDGIITTFAVVASVSGASLSIGLLLLLGLATVFADALSMSVSDYMSTKAEVEMKKSRLAEMERQSDFTEGVQREELESILLNRNFSKREADTIITLINRDKRIVSAILDEFDTEDDGNGAGSAVISATVTFVSFVIFGLIPLISTIFLDIFTPFISSCLWTGITLICLGYFKSRVTKQKPFFSSMVMLALGGGCSAIAYVIASSLSHLADESGSGAAAEVATETVKKAVQVIAGNAAE